jgi:DNA-binding XRE family transcriptional regulator
MNIAHISRRLREMRKAAGLTQTDLARRLGVSRHTISKIEEGKWCSLDMLLCIGEILKFAVELKEYGNEQNH